jgi:hypothetical protein
MQNPKLQNTIWGVYSILDNQVWAPYPILKKYNMGYGPNIVFVPHSGKYNMGYGPHIGKYNMGYGPHIGKYNMGYGPHIGKYNMGSHEKMRYGHCTKYPMSHPILDNELVLELTRLLTPNLLSEIELYVMHQKESNHPIFDQNGVSDPKFALF